MGASGVARLETGEYDPALYEATDEISIGVAALEDAIFIAKDREYEECYAQAQPFLGMCSRHDAMFAGTWRQKSGPFSNVHLSKLAPGIRRKSSAIFDLTIPNRRLLDFFKISADGQLPYEMLEAVEILLGEDLRLCNFPEIYDMALQDYVRIGNLEMASAWHQKICFKSERKPHPIYAGLGDGTIDEYDLLQRDLGVTQGGVIYSLEDGHRTIPRTIETLTPYLEVDRPKIVYINPHNLYPTELDRNNLRECRGVFMYDAACADDLSADSVEWLEGDVASGVYPERQLAKALDRAETYGVPLVNWTTATDPWDGGWDGARTEDVLASSAGASSNGTEVHGMKRFARWTYIGNFNWDRMCEKAGYDPAGAVAKAFLKKYGATLHEAQMRRTWIIEGTINKGILLRCQPSPYRTDDLPIIHARYKFINNFTLGLGEYAIAEGPERLYNWFLRQRMTATERKARPMMEVDRGAIDTSQKGIFDGDFSFRGDGLVFKRQGLPSGSVMKAVDYPADAVSAAENGQMSMEQEIMSLTGTSPNSVGSPSGGITAKEAGIIQGNFGDELQGHANRLSDQLAMVVDQIRDLHAQYEETPRIARAPAEGGQPGKAVIVPPEVWENEYFTTVTGPGSVASRAALIAGMDRLKGYATELLPLSGLLPNGEEFLKLFIKTLGMDASIGAKLIGGPAPKDENPMRTAISASLTGAQLTSSERIMVWQWFKGEALPQEVKRGIILDMMIQAQSRQLTAGKPALALPAPEQHPMFPPGAGMEAAGGDPSAPPDAGSDGGDVASAPPAGGSPTDAGMANSMGKEMSMGVPQ